jgi:hypothetical protein
MSSVLSQNILQHDIVEHRIGHQPMKMTACNLATLPKLLAA